MNDQNQTKDTNQTAKQIPFATAADWANFTHRGYADLHDLNRVSIDVDPEPGVKNAQEWVGQVRR